MRVEIIQRGGYFYDADGKENHVLKGEVVELHDGWAGELVRFGIAIPAPEEKKPVHEEKKEPVIETAMPPKHENAAKRTGKPKAVK